MSPVKVAEALFLSFPSNILVDWEKRIPGLSKKGRRWERCVEIYLKEIFMSPFFFQGGVVFNEHV